MRVSQIKRATKETDINLSLDLDGSGKACISTGIGFFDHMLTAFCVHSGIDLSIECKGDLEVDCHHTIEDVGIVLGQAIYEALGEKKNINRYGSFLIPMDEALAECIMDLSNRAYLVFNCSFKASMVGGYDTQMVKEFFIAIANNARITLHLNLRYGDNDHHNIEAIYKAFAHAFKMAIKKTDVEMLSTKGSL